MPTCPTRTTELHTVLCRNDREVERLFSLFQAFPTMTYANQATEMGSVPDTTSTVSDRNGDAGGRPH